MTRLNLTLLVAVLLSAFYLVHVQYESRRLYTARDRARAQAERLEAEYEQLLVHKRSQATPSRVQQLAANQLGMRPAHPGITEYLHGAPGAGAAGRAQAGHVTPEARP